MGVSHRLWETLQVCIGKKFVIESDRYAIGWKEGLLKRGLVASEDS